MNLKKLEEPPVVEDKKAMPLESDLQIPIADA